MSRALSQGVSAVEALLKQDPALANEISTGGAHPLHMCGMSACNQLVTEYLVSRGADIKAQDTYGYRPLHRMASNNLGVGTEALPQLLHRGSLAHSRLASLLGDANELSMHLLCACTHWTSGP